MSENALELKSKFLLIRLPEQRIDDLSYHVGYIESVIDDAIEDKSVLPELVRNGNLGRVMVEGSISFVERSEGNKPGQYDEKVIVRRPGELTLSLFVSRFLPNSIFQKIYSRLDSAGYFLKIRVSDH